jgi:hypothetical protein
MFLAMLVLALAVPLSAGAQDRFEVQLADRVRDQMQQALENACNTEALKNDRVACLERKVELLAGQVVALHKSLPGMIDRGVKAALEPRVYRNAAEQAR